MALPVPEPPPDETVVLLAVIPAPRLLPVESDAYVPELCRHPRPDRRAWLDDLDAGMKDQ